MTPQPRLELRSREAVLSSNFIFETGWWTEGGL
jgi:hypothetical protein